MVRNQLPAQVVKKSNVFVTITINARYIDNHYQRVAILYNSTYSCRYFSLGETYFIYFVARGKF